MSSTGTHGLNVVKEIIHTNNRPPPATLSKAYSRSTKAIHNSFFFARYFSCICLTMNMASVVPFPEVTPNCILSKVPLLFTFFSTSLSSRPTFITWSMNLIPQWDDNPEHPLFLCIYTQHPSLPPVLRYVTLPYNSISQIGDPTNSCRNRAFYQSISDVPPKVRLLCQMDRIAFLTSC